MANYLCPILRYRSIMKRIFCLLFIGFTIIAKANGYASLSANDFFQISTLEEVPDPSNLDFELIEIGVIHLTNVYRESKNIPLLSYEKKLHKAALFHATAMVKNNFFSHQNKYDKNLRHLNNRTDAAGYIDYQALGENLYYGYIDFQEENTYMNVITKITESFIQSKEHEHNLVDDSYAEIGCAIQFESKITDGYLQYYFVQNFGTRF